MGGRSDDGIMSSRPKYEEGGNVGFFRGILNALNPTSGQVIKRMQDVQEAPSLGETLFSPSDAPLEFRTQAEAEAYLEANPDFIKPIKILGTGETINQKTTDTTIKPDIDTSTTDIKQSDTDTKQSDQELIKSYMDMFSEAMGESKEDLSRQRYLQLAKFGANLLAQPGGDLMGAIGKAGAPSIEGLSEIEARKSAANREIKLAALKTAIAQMDNPTQEKIETLARMSGLEIKDVAKMMLDEDSDSTLEKIEIMADALEGTVGADAAFRIAEQISDAGLKLSQVKQLPVDKKGKPKEDVPDGYYYDEKTNIYEVKDGKPAILKRK
jgi:hypothetical protein